MSGHSKWATIKRQKGAADKKRGAAFTKLSNAISIAARGGGDQTANFKLRIAIEKAKEANMPKDTIERAVKRGTGELEGAQIEEITYEGFGPAGVAIIITTLTDNRNRTAANLKHYLSDRGGNLGGANSVSYLFERKGVVRTSLASQTPAEKDAWEMKLIEAGAEDFKEDGLALAIYIKPEKLQTFKEALEKQGIKAESADLEFIPKEPVKIDDPTREKLEKLFEALDEDDDVQDFYTNADF